MAQDEFSKAVEFTQVSEFPKCTEKYIDSPEFVPAPDEFAYPGTTDTTDNRDRSGASTKYAMMYVAAVASAIMGFVALTDGFTDMSLFGGAGPAQQQEEVEVPGIGAITDIEGEEGDPSFHVSMAKTDGVTLYYSYVVWLGDQMTPVTVYASAYDQEGHEVKSEYDPDEWTGSRDLFEYTIDVSDLEGDITLVLTGTYTKDGEDGKIVKVVHPDDMALMPELSASIDSVSQQGEWSIIDYQSFFIINENDPHMRDYDLSVTQFSLNWYDENGEYIGGGASVWEPNSLPIREMLASVPGYMFTYSGPAHTDYAPDEASYFSVNLLLTDTTTDKRYEVDTEPQPLKGEGIDLGNILSTNTDWYSESTGEYLHFGSTYGFKKYNIDESVLFNRFAWEGLSDSQFMIHESYYKLDEPHYDSYVMNIEDTGDGYRFSRLSDGAEFVPAQNVSYEGYGYMVNICDYDLTETLLYLGSFNTMFRMTGSSFEIEEIDFIDGSHAVLKPYGSSGSSWWPGNITCAYDNPEPDSPLAAVVRLDIPSFINTSSSSQFMGVLTASVEYYGEGVMLVLRPDEGFVDHNTIMMWEGETEEVETKASETVHLVNTLGDASDVKIESVGVGEGHRDTAIRMWEYYFSGVGTKLTLVNIEKYIADTQESDDSIIIRDEDAPQEDWYIAQGTVTNTYHYIYHYEIS